MNTGFRLPLNDLQFMNQDYLATIKDYYFTYRDTSITDYEITGAFWKKKTEKAIRKGGLSGGVPQSHTPHHVPCHSNNIQSHSSKH